MWLNESRALGGRRTPARGLASIAALGLLTLAATIGCGRGEGSSAGNGGGAAGLIWVARGDTLLGIDPASARITRRIGTEYSYTNLMLADNGLWWAGRNLDFVLRLDPRTGRADSVQVPQGSTPGNVLAAEGSLWVANWGNGKVLRIDPARRQIIASIDVAEEESFHNRMVLAAGGGLIWASAFFGDEDLFRIDPQSNAVTGRIEGLGDGVRDVAFGEGSVWAVSVHDGRVHRVDPATLEVTARIAVFNGPVSIAVGEGSVWVVKAGDGTVDRIDPRTNTVVATFPIGGQLEEILTAHGSIWLLNGADSSLVRINPRTDEVTAVVPLGGEPLAFAAGM